MVWELCACIVYSIYTKVTPKNQNKRLKIFNESEDGWKKSCEWALNKYALSASNDRISAIFGEFNWRVYDVTITTPQKNKAD